MLFVLAAAGCANAPLPPGEAREAALRSAVGECQRAQRDDQRKLDQFARQLREERRRNEEMQQKIESLLAIDRDLRMRRGGE